MSEIEEQLKVYKDELEKVKGQLRQARTDLASQAKKTVADLESSIPALEAKAKEKSDKVALLDKMILDKQKKHDEIKEFHAEHYKNLENSLAKEHSLRMSNLDEREKAQNRRDEEYKSKVVILAHHQAALDSGQTNLAKAQKNLENDRKELADKQLRASHEINESKRKIAEEYSTLSLKKENFNKDKSELINQIKQVSEKQDKVSAVLAREYNLDKRDKDAQTKEYFNSKKSEELNQQFIALKADRIRLNNREELQNAREKNLNDREKNLKELEAKV